MKLPGQLTAEYTIKGFMLLIVALVVIASLAFGAFQLTRVEGFRFLFWSQEGWKPRAERLQADLDRVVRAQQLAQAAQVAANKATEKRYADVAERIDNETVQHLENELAAAERYIATHGVRPQAPCRASSEAGSPAADYRPGVSKETGPTAFVDEPQAFVKAEDIRICTRNTIQAEAARDWALQLEASSAGN